MSHHSSDEEYEVVGESDYEYIEYSEESAQEDQEEAEEFQEEEKSAEQEVPEDAKSEYTVVSDYTYPTSRGGGRPDDDEEEELDDDSWARRLQLLQVLFQGTWDTAKLKECVSSVQELIKAMRMSQELTDDEQLALLVADMETLLDKLITLGPDTPYVGDLLVELVDDLLGFGWDCIFSNAVIHDVLYCLAQTHTNLNCIRTGVKQVYFIVDKGQWLHKADAVRIAEAAILGNWLGDLQVYMYAIQLYSKLLEERAVDLIATLDLRVYHKLLRCDVRYVPPKHQKLSLCIRAFLEPKLSSDACANSSVFGNSDILLCTDLYKYWIRPELFLSRSFRTRISETFMNEFSQDEHSATIIYSALYVEWCQTTFTPDSQQAVIEWFGHLKSYCKRDDPLVMAIWDYLEDAQYGTYGQFLDRISKNTEKENEKDQKSSSEPQPPTKEEIDAAFEADAPVDETIVNEEDAAFNVTNIEGMALLRDMINQVIPESETTPPTKEPLSETAWV